MPYLNSEKETILNFDYQTQGWHAWSSIPSHIKKLELMGWKRIQESIENGVVIDAQFEAPKKAITFRDLTRPSLPRSNAFLPHRIQETTQEAQSCE